MSRPLDRSETPAARASIPTSFPLPSMFSSRRRAAVGAPVHLSSSSPELRRHLGEEISFGRVTQRAIAAARATEVESTRMTSTDRSSDWDERAGHEARRRCAGGQRNGRGEEKNLTAPEERECGGIRRH